MNDNNDFKSKWEKREFWFQFFKNEENLRYFYFIESCKNKDYSETTQMHLHHIIPKYPSRVSELIKGKRQSLNSWSCKPITPNKIVANKIKIL